MLLVEMLLVIEIIVGVCISWLEIVTYNDLLRKICSTVHAHIWYLSVQFVWFIQLFLQHVWCKGSAWSFAMCTLTENSLACVHHS